MTVLLLDEICQYFGWDSSLVVTLSLPVLWPLCAAWMITYFLTSEWVFIGLHLGGITGLQHRPARRTIIKLFKLDLTTKG
ncbi:hypothetical protein [Celeribacter sp.]|uniref:hypothetical protein n=1 Tax=Celeribacter sp. TaxID=1890673 RepID=UPI003A906CE7